jgi:hypothetical protein
MRRFLHAGHGMISTETFMSIWEGCGYQVRNPASLECSPCFVPSLSCSNDHLMYFKSREKRREDGQGESAIVFVSISGET